MLARTARRVPVSSEVRVLLGLPEQEGEVSGEGLARAILHASADVLWTGGAEGAGAGLEQAVSPGVRAAVVAEGNPNGFTPEARVEYARSGGTDRWSAYEIKPTTPWNYGLVLDEKDPAASFEVVKKPWPESDQPWTPATTPIELKVEGKRIPEWQLDRYGLVAPLQDSPALSDEPTETLTLIPMGAARLRISSFPVIGEGPSAHRWTPPAE